MSKLTITKGDITKFDGDAIVNAANESLLGGGGVDGAIHRAAGPDLLKECITLHGCQTGQAKITKGYNLKAKFIIHTVGPIYYDYSPDIAQKLLSSCYETSLNIAKQNKIRSLAFPLISAGVYGYPKREAIQVAVETIKKNMGDIDVCLVLFSDDLLNIAKQDFQDLCVE